MTQILLHQPIRGHAAGEKIDVPADVAEYEVAGGRASIPGSTVDRTNLFGVSSPSKDQTLSANREDPEDGPPTVAKPTVVPRDDLASVQGPGIGEEPEKDFSPTDHTVEEVNAYLADHPKDAPRVLRYEREGKKRAGILTHAGATAPAPEPDPAA